MRLREWVGLVVFSILLHVVIFWPLPAPPHDGGRASPLIVSLPEVRRSSVAPEAELVFVEGRDPGLEAGGQAEVVRQTAKAYPRRSSNQLAGVKQRMPPSLEAAKESIGGESTTGKLEESSDLTATSSKEDLSPSLSRYRLAIAAEAIRMSGPLERLVAPDFQGKLVVLVQLRGLDTIPQVSLEGASGSERIDHEVLTVFKKAANFVPVSIAGDVGEVSVRLPVHFGVAALE